MSNILFNVQSAVALMLQSLDEISERIIEISHLDADANTYIGLKKKLGIDLPNLELELELMKKIKNGTSEEFDPTFMYLIGIGSHIRESLIYLTLMKMGDRVPE